jgi:hypothetical protein
MKESIRLNKLVRELLKELPQRQKDIISGRFGLDQEKPVTLAKLGGAYNITRERVRQIESLSLDTIKKKKSSDDLGFFVQLVKNYLKNAGGLKREDLLLSDLQKLLKAQKTPSSDNQLRFLLEAANCFKFSKENSSTYAFWYLSEDIKKRAQDFVKDLLEALKPKKKEVVEGKQFENIFSSVIKKKKITEEVAMNYASISKRFVKNAYGEFGLTHWREINPKTARDWAHLVLRKERKPLHFTEIAKIVNGLRDDKKIHHQTIHNELIKDDKFVLVGKGMYGLSEFGLIPGTAREVITHLISNHGPMTSDKLLNLILKERFVKPNTVLINLQNRKHFERLGDGRYTIREA